MGRWFCVLLILRLFVVLFSVLFVVCFDDLRRGVCQVWFCWGTLAALLNLCVFVVILLLAACGWVVLYFCFVLVFWVVDV